MATASRPTRRTHDCADRQARNRLIAVVALVAVAVVAALGVYWWVFRSREPARDGAPNWFPDGQAIVFATEVGSGRADIYRMDADGSGRRVLVEHGANDTSPAISPDGTRLAFESDRDGNPEIYVMDLASGRLTRLTTDPAGDSAPAWSPDGQRIVFTSDREHRASADVYVMNADGSGVQRLTSDLANWAPQFAPDGRRVAIQVDRDIVILDLVDGTRTQLTRDPQNGMNPTWSPDGQRLAFVSTRNRRAEIFTMHADGTNPQLLVTMAAGSVIDPRWSPDGTRVVFVMVPDLQPRPGEDVRPEHVQAIYTIDVASGVVTRLSR